MNFLDDCCDKMSGEHYISKSILEQLGNFTTEGLPGVLDKMTSVPKGAVVAKVLCSRHNSALSPLDTAAGCAFQQLVAANRHLRNPVLNRRRERHFLVDGYAIELWAAKTLAALHHGGIAKVGGRKTLEIVDFSTQQVVEALWGGPLEEPLGFYLEPKDRTKGISGGYAPLTLGDELVGLQVQLVGIKFYCIVSVPKKSPLPSVENYRPPIVRYVKNGFTSVIHFAWSGIRRGDYIYQEYNG